MRAYVSLLGLIFGAQAGSVSREQLLQLVHSSPIHVGAHDKSKWLNLFSPSATVSDPVGTGENIGHDMISNFWDAFVSETAVKFDVLMPDVVSNLTGCTDSACRAAVGRFVKIHSTMSTGFSVDIDAVLIYEVTGTPDGLKIEGLRTYWPLMEMTQKVLAGGMQAMKASVGMIGRLGVSGFVEYNKGFLGIGSWGENDLTAVVAAVRSSNWEEFSRILSGCRVEIQRSRRSSLQAAWKLLGACKPDLQRVYASGYEVGAAMTCQDTPSSQVLRMKFGGITSGWKATSFEVFSDDDVVKDILQDALTLNGAHHGKAQDEL